MSVYPLLIVFDLDYTLWPFWVDTHVTPPFSKDRSGNVVDYRGKKIKHYPNVLEIFEKLKKHGIKIGVASRTSEIDGANELLHLFDWNKYITYKQIYPGSKIRHFNQIQKDSNIKFSEMLFFDDEHRNIRDLEQLGVLSILVDDGMTMEVLKHGLKEYEMKHLKNKNKV